MCGSSRHRFKRFGSLKIPLSLTLGIFRQSQIDVTALDHALLAPVKIFGDRQARMRRTAVFRRACVRGETADAARISPAQ